MKKGGRILNISSDMGRLRILSPELQKEYSRTDLRIAELDQLQENYVASI